MSSFWALNWRKLALRGILSIILGILAFVWPALTLEVLVILFGIYALVDGVLMVYTALTNLRVYPLLGRLLIGGLVGIAVGVIALIFRRMTATIVLYLLAARLVIVGVLDVLNAILLRQELRGEWMLALSGVISVVVGIVLLIQPLQSLIAIIWLLAGSAIVVGVLLLVLSWRLQRWAGSLPASDPGVGSL